MGAFAIDWRSLPARMPSDVRRALPLCGVLSVALGFALVLGAHLSNAQPSSTRPFGWAGPSAFEYAVAMVRKDLVLATTLPALLLGSRALSSFSPLRESSARVAGTFVTHAAMLVGAVVAAAGIGAWGAFHTPGDAFVAFCVAHALLALAFYAIGFLWSAALPRFALAGALATWAFFVLFYDNLLQVRVLRELGQPGLDARAFPAWFYAGQALSPLTSYRGILILWRERFRDYVEKLALKGADLPAWMTPITFCLVLVLAWVLVPLALALVAWRVRRALAVRAARRVGATLKHAAQDA